MAFEFELPNPNTTPAAATAKFGAADLVRAPGKHRELLDPREPGRRDLDPVGDARAEAGSRRLAPRRQAPVPRGGADLLLGQAGRDLLADDPVEDDVRGVAQDLRPDHGERHADDREGDDEEDAGQLGAEGLDQAAEGALEVLRLLGRQPDATERPTARAGRRRTAAGCPGHHAASSVLSCE